MADYVHYLGFTRKRADLSFETFDQHWRTVHSDLVLAGRDPGPIMGYTQNVRITGEDAPGSDFDGAPELWIRDDAALETLFASAPFQEAYHADSPKFVNPQVISFFIRDETVIAARADPSDVRLIRLIYRPQGATSLAEHDRQWRESRTPLFLARAAPRRLVRSRIVSAEAAGTDADAFYGIESSWWPDLNALAEALREPVQGQVQEQRLIARERIQFPLR